MSLPAVEDLTSALVATAVPSGRLLGPFESPVTHARCVGEALTVQGTGGDNLAIYQGLMAASPGCVLVIALGGSLAAGHWGSLLTQAALAAGVAGVVIDGGIRDTAELAELGLPVFHRGVCPRKAGKEHDGVVGGAIAIDGVEIRTGALVVADSDGIVVLEGEAEHALLEEVATIVTSEREIEARLSCGAAIPEAFGLAGLVPPE